MKRGHPYIDVFGKGSITMEKAVQTSQRTDQELSSVQFLTITAAFVALTYIFTAFINVKLPIAANGGLIHLGNVPLFIGAILFGKKTEPLPVESEWVSLTFSPAGPCGHHLL